MKPALIILAAMVVVGLVLYILDRFHHQPDDEEETPIVKPKTTCNDECCSINDVCPSEMMLAGINKEIEYYDDEELDSFAGGRPTNTPTLRLSNSATYSTPCSPKT